MVSAWVASSEPYLAGVGLRLLHGNRDVSRAPYRCVEMWHQWRLGERSISTEKVDERVREQFLEEAGLDEPPRVLALHHARLLDHIMNGGVSEDEAVLQDLLQNRNHSILAHGLQPIEKKSTVRFLEYVDALVEAPEARVGAEHARLRGL